jgi:hypothetical protein
MRIKALSGNKPHPSWGGWNKFLKTCDLRDEFEGVKYFGKTNCNYILFPSGMLVQNFGYNGVALMHRVRDNGVEKVEAEVRKTYEDLASEIARLTRS